MPRYIDADAFKQKLADKNIFFPALYKNELNEMPTDDVAPKSEVAREIFEEIEENIVKLGSTSLYGGIKWDVLAELKKKYTEGEGC